MENISNKSGVYCFRNIHNNKIYIGSSMCIRQRYSKHKSRFKLKKCGKSIMDKVYRKYNLEDFEFQVLLYTEDYELWENLLIELLNPEYNTASMSNGKLQPNLGKKFSQEWINKLGTCEKHSEETKKKLIKLNKENACKIQFKKENKILNFNSWREAGIYFKLKDYKNTSGYFTKTIKNNKFYWKGWVISKLNSQKKKVKLITKSESIDFSSSFECDRYLNLWRGATSHAIRNRSGKLHGYTVIYI